MPAFPYQKKLIDIWFDAFPATRLLMNFDEPQALAYGTERGAGWRLDCLGDLRTKWAHMLDFYPEQIARTGIQDVWKRSPVSLETCGVPGSWKAAGLGHPLHPRRGAALACHFGERQIEPHPA